jgi:hypothetical protein
MSSVISLTKQKRFFRAQTYEWSTKQCNFILREIRSSELKQYYPSAICRWNDDKRDFDVTKELFINGQMNNDDIVYYEGHGAPGGLYLGKGNFVDIADGVGYLEGSSGVDLRCFGDFTKWVFNYSCLTMNENPRSKSDYLRYDHVNNCCPYYLWNYQASFNGCHSISGFRSLAYQFGNACMKYNWLNICTKRQESVVDLWTDFALRWIGPSKQSIWDAFQCSVQHCYVNNNVGIDCSTVGVCGWLKTPVNTWFCFDGTSEKYADAVPYSLSLMDPVTSVWQPLSGADCMSIATATFGSPLYKNSSF